MHRGGDALTVTVGAGRVGRRRPMEEAILRVVVEVVEMVEVSGGSCGGGGASTAAVGAVSVSEHRPVDEAILTVATEEVQAVEVTVAAVEVETLRLPLSPVSVLVDSHRWR